MIIITVAPPKLVAVHSAYATESLPPLPVWPDLPVPVSHRTGPSSVSPTGNLRFPNPVRWPALQPLLAPTNQANGCALAICPGGAHVEESKTKEGYCVAKWFNDQNEKRFYHARKLNGMAARLIKFKHGKHGSGLGISGTDSASWPSACIQWLGQQGFLDAGPERH